MKTTIRPIVLAFAATFLVGGIAFAGSAKHEGRFGADAVFVYKTTSTAKIAKIDGESLLVTDEKSGKEIALQLSGKTKIKGANGEKVATNSLTAGQRLQIVHRGDQVLKITVLS